MKGGNLSQRVGGGGGGGGGGAWGGGGGGGGGGGRVSLRVRVEVFLIFFLDNMI